MSPVFLSSPRPNRPPPSRCHTCRFQTPSSPFHFLFLSFDTLSCTSGPSPYEPRSRSGMTMTFEYSPSGSNLLGPLSLPLRQTRLRPTACACTTASPRHACACRTVTRKVTRILPSACACTTAPRCTPHTRSPRPRCSYRRRAGGNCMKIGLPRKLILSKRKGLEVILFKIQ